MLTDSVFICSSLGASHNHNRRRRWTDSTVYHQARASLQSQQAFNTAHPQLTSLVKLLLEGTWCKCFQWTIVIHLLLLIQTIYQYLCESFHIGLLSSIPPNCQKFLLLIIHQEPFSLIHRSWLIKIQKTVNPSFCLLRTIWCVRNVPKCIKLPNRPLSS